MGVSIHRSLKDDVIARAFELGFAVAGATGVEPLSRWRHEVSKRIEEGTIPAEDWHRRNLQLDPRGTMPGAASILVLVRPYSPYVWPFPRGVAAYSAHYREYPKGLAATHQLADWLASLGFRAIAQPRLPSKALAVKAGVGSYGTNSLIHCREFGSFVTIHAILTDARLDPDEPAALSECGQCDACIRACPVGAIAGPGVVDLRKCVRAHMGSGKIVPAELREGYGTSILGCEACQRSCPRNARALKAASMPPADELEAFSLRGFLSDTGGPLKERLDRMAGLVGANYARENRVLADAAIAAGNARDPDLVGALARALGHPHAPVRAHTAWALGVADGADAEQILRKALASEHDVVVRNEIRMALGEAFRP